MLQQLLRVAGTIPAGVLNVVEIGIQRIRKRSVEGEADRKNAGVSGDGLVLAGDFNLAADHLAPARFRREENDQVIGLADL